MFLQNEPHIESKDVSSKARNHLFVLTKDDYNTKTEHNKSKERGEYDKQRPSTPRTERAVVPPSSFDPDTITNSTYNYNPSNKQRKIQHFNNEEFTPENTSCRLEGPDASTVEPKLGSSEGDYLSPTSKATMAKSQQ